jgi:hypothetical protein
MLQLSVQQIIGRFRQGLDKLAGRPGAYKHIQTYYDGRLGDIGDNQLERDALMATLWNDIRPTDSVGQYLTRYEVSQRAWQIVKQEFSKPQWWMSAIRRFATELFNENADRAQTLFQQDLENRYKNADDLDSTTESIFAFGRVLTDKYQGDSSIDSSEQFDGGSSDEYYDDLSHPVTQFPNALFQAWRKIPGPPSLCVPFSLANTTTRSAPAQ